MINKKLARLLNLTLHEDIFCYVNDKLSYYKDGKPTEVTEEFLENLIEGIKTVTPEDRGIIASRVTAHIANNPGSMTPLYDCYKKYKDYQYEEYLKVAKELMANYKVHSIIDPFPIEQVDGMWTENGIKTQSV